MRKALLWFALLISSGCVAMLPAALETPSGILSLGSIGSTIVQFTYGESDGCKFPVGWMPRQYVFDENRMIVETWEQNYQIIKKTSWEAEDVTWNEVVAATSRKAAGSRTALALVLKKRSRTEIRRDIVTTFTTPSGREMRDPLERPGEPFYPRIREQRVGVTMYTYTAFFFSKSRQPSGILAAAGPVSGPCRTTTPGAQVLAVGQKTPATRANLQRGDIITTVNEQVAEYGTLYSLLKPGDNTLFVCRNGHTSKRVLRLPKAQSPP